MSSDSAAVRRSTASRLASGFGTGLAVLAIVLVVLWLTLQWGILPNVDRWREPIAQHAGRVLGLPVTIAAIRARSTGFMPDLELTDVVVHDTAKREALRLSRVQAQLSPRSLLTWRPHFARLAIESALLDARRDAQGRLHVAGIDLSQAADGTDVHPADWLFEQREVTVRGATVRWTDEQRQAPTLELAQVDITVRNLLTHHDVTLAATPPSTWGDRFTVNASFTQPFVSAGGFVGAGEWRSWSGNVDIDLPRADAAQLRRYVDLPFRLDTGRGSAKARLEVERGELRGAVADITLADVALRWAEALAPWDISRLEGRMVMRHTPPGGARGAAESTRLALEGFTFTTPDGRVWPKGDMALTLRGPSVAPGRPKPLTTPSGGSERSERGGPFQKPTGGELEAQHIDVAMLALLTTRLPLGAQQHALLESMQARGHAERFHAQWDGPVDAPAAWRLRANVQGLALREQDVPLASNVRRQVIGRPGVEGASVEIDANQGGGRASVRVVQGSASFPGIFERPRIALDRLDASLRWTVAPLADAPAGTTPLVEVRIDEATFANADAQGRFAGTWTSGEKPDARTPGTADIEGRIERGKAAAVARYLPLGVPPESRRYVEQAILDGLVTDAAFRVKGELRHFPFAASDRARGAAKGSEFVVKGKVSEGRMNLAPELRAGPPPALPPPGRPKAGEPPRGAASEASVGGPSAGSGDTMSPLWPLLEQLGGELIFEGANMRIRRAAARVEGVTLNDVVGDVDFDRPPSLLTIGGVATGSAADMLRFVRRSPVDGWTERALSQTTATGPAELKLALSLPLRDLDASSVRGTVTLPGNDVRIRPDVPLLAQARGQVEFSEKGLSIGEATARVYGGEASFSGGTRDGGTIGFSAQGVISADGFAQAKAELGEITNLAAVMRGRTPYRLDLSFRRGQPEWVVTSNLEGMAVDLPAPLAKAADATLPLRVSSALVPGRGDDARGAAREPQRDQARDQQRDQLRVEAGNVFTATFLRDVGGTLPKVLAGGIGIGHAAPQPASGVHAAVKTASLDLDAWRQAAAKLGVDLGDGTPAPRAGRSGAAGGAGAGTGTTAGASAAPGAGPGAGSGAGSGAVADSGYAPRAIALEVDDLRIDARRLSRVTAGLTQDAEGSWRATVEADQLSGFAQWRPAARNRPPRLEARLARLALPAAASDSVDALLSDEAPENPPALDIVIDDLELRGRKLGRVEIQAAHERVGNDALAWALTKLAVSTPEARLTGTGRWLAATDGSKQRRTVIDFKLELADSGAYLTRFGLPDVLRGGQGAIGGQISWAGSPITWHAPSLAGSLHLDIDAGQFLKAGPGAARLLGVLNLQSLPRRLLFDFRDLFSEGFAFDSITGDVRIDHGQAMTNNVRMRGVQAIVLMEGSADVLRETQDLRVWVVPEIDAGAASLAYAAINPAVGLGTFLAQMFLRRPLMEASTREFLVQGSWDDPKVVRLERKAGDRMPDLGAARVVPGEAAPAPALPATPPAPSAPAPAEPDAPAAPPPSNTPDPP